MNFDNLLLNELMTGLYRFMNLNFFWICSSDFDIIHHIA